MFARQLLGIWIAFNLVIWTGAATAEDFSKYDNESELLKVVRRIPASDKSANAEGYARLLALNPNKELYWSKYERYSGASETGLFKIVRAIPASNRSANALGYARLLSLAPNNDLYRTKFERYSRQAERPASVNSTSELGSYLAGSWCVLDDDPTYVGGPHVKKLIILADGSYSLFSKPAAALSWHGAKEKGRLSFGEGRFPETGEKYFFAVSKEFGAPKLLVGSDGRTVYWKEVIHDLGQTTRDSCNKFE